MNNVIQFPVPEAPMAEMVEQDEQETVLQPSPPTVIRIVIPDPRGPHPVAVALAWGIIVLAIVTVFL